MNTFNPKKLLLSKWTAVNPKNKERHFIVTELIKDEEENITACILEAVMNKNNYEMDFVDKPYFFALCSKYSRSKFEE